MKVSAKSALATAIRRALTRWSALTRHRDDGHIEIDNNAAERARCAPSPRGRRRQRSVVDATGIIRRVALKAAMQDGATTFGVAG